MPEQPLEERPAGNPRPVHGLLHYRHHCPTNARPGQPICGTPATIGSYTKIPPLDQAQYQDCVVCEDLIGAADTVCPNCGGKLRP